MYILTSHVFVTLSEVLASTRSDLLPRSSFSPYGVSLIVIAAAIGIRLLLDPLLGDRTPFITLFLAIAFVAWYAGSGPAWLALFAGVFGTAYFILEPRYSFAIGRPDYLVGLVLFGLAGWTIIALFESLRKAQLRVAKKSDLLKATLASIGDAVITIDGNNHIISMNAVAVLLTGWTEAEAQGQALDSVFHIVNESTRQPVENPTRRVLKDGVIVGLANHTVLIAKDGAERSIDDSAAPIRNKNGQVDGCVLVFRDISERRRAEVEKQVAQEQIATTLENVKDGFIRYDRDWRIVYVNAEAERINQLARSEMVGKTPWELFPAVVGTKLEAEFRRAVAEQVTVEFENYYEPCGRWYLEKAFPTADGGLTVYTRDITEQKQAQDSLRQKEAELEKLTENTSVKLMRCSRDLRYRFVNQACADYVGLPREQIQGASIESILGPAAFAVIRPRIEQVLRGETVEYESEIPYDRTGPRWVQARYVPDYDEAGQVQGWYASVLDITERKRAEEAVRESEGRYRELVENANSLIIKMDGQGRILFFNEYAQEFFGYSLSEVLGQNVKMLVPPVESGSGRDLGEMAGTILRNPDDFATHVNENVRKNGQRVWISWRNKAIRGPEGQIIGNLAIGQDITERKQVEEQLRESEERWRNLAEALPNLVWTDLPDGQCDYLSSQWATYTGYPVEELLGLAWANKVLHPDDRERTLACWMTAVADKGIYDLEYRLRRHDGEYHWFKTRGVSIRDGQGRIVKWFGTCTDIEDQKRAESTLKEADRKKNEFLATLAHELRNPLAPLRNSLQLLKLAKDNSEVAEKSRAMMERQVVQMCHLIDDLMDLSRITQGKIVLQKTRMKLADAVRDAVETSRPLIEERGQELVLDVPPDPIYVDGDSTRLCQVFANLLNNAAKYTHTGGRIQLAVERQGSDAVVSVEDNGVGIPPPMLSKVFEMFTQVDHSLEQSQGGLGIGLNIVKRLVEMHEGSIVAESAGHGRGSRFVVRLPVVLTSHPAVLDQAGPQMIPPTTRRRILVVDDNADGAVSLSLMLSLMGNETQTAHDGLEAVAKAEAFRPDVILMDIGMPKLHGYDACRRIREEPWGRDIILVAQTGWGQEEDRRKSKEAGFNGHLVKPVEVAELERLLVELKKEN